MLSLQVDMEVAAVRARTLDLEADLAAVTHC